MSKNSIGARIIHKISDLPSGTTGYMPTVPSNNDHTTGWIDSDIYKGEFYINTNTSQVWTRVNSGLTITEEGIVEFILSDTSTHKLPQRFMPDYKSGDFTFYGGDVYFQDVGGTGLRTLMLDANGIVISGVTTGTGTITKVSAGDGMNFIDIISTGSVHMGTPSSITTSSTNSVSTSSHTHSINGFLALSGGTMTGDLYTNTLYPGTNGIYMYNQSILYLDHNEQQSSWIMSDNYGDGPMSAGVVYSTTNGTAHQFVEYDNATLIASFSTSSSSIYSPLYAYLLSDSTQSNVVYFNSSTKELTYGSKSNITNGFLALSGGTMTGTIIGTSLNLNGSIYISGLTSSTQTQVLYYNTTTKQVSYGSASTGTVTSVAVGNGMNFTTFTTSGTITMGTPSGITTSTTNLVNAGGHSHSISGFLALSGGTMIGTLIGTQLNLSGKLYISGLTSDSTPTNIVYYNTTTKQLSYGSGGGNYLALTGGTMTGDLTISKSNSTINLKLPSLDTASINFYDDSNISGYINFDYYNNLFNICTSNTTTDISIGTDDIERIRIFGSTGHIGLYSKITTVASTVANAGLNIPHGSAPSSPINGDMWTTTSGLYVRINGATVGPLGTGGSSGNYLNLTGGTMTGKLITTGSTTTANINLPHGGTPSSLVNGDMWTTTSGLYVRIGGTTVGPLGTGGGVSGNYLNLTGGTMTGTLIGTQLNLSGKLYVSGLTSATKTMAVYYDTTTKELTYGAPSGVTGNYLALSGGTMTGVLSGTTAYFNNLVGNTTGNIGTGNTFFGVWAGSANTIGLKNTYIGFAAGYYQTTGTGNTFIGYGTAPASNPSISGCVFIGNSAGSLESNNNRLHIDNSQTSTPLIYGEFDNNILKVNGKLYLNGIDITGNTSPNILTYNDTTKEINYNDASNLRVNYASTSYSSTYSQTVDMTISSHGFWEDIVDEGGSYTYYTIPYGGSRLMLTNSRGFNVGINYSLNLYDSISDSTIYADNTISQSQIWLLSSIDNMVCVDYATSADYLGGQPLSSFLLKAQEYNVITSGTSITYNCANGLNQKVTATTGFTVTISNYLNGYSGKLLVNLTTSTNSIITSPVGLKNGTFTNLSSGYYIINWTYDGSNVFYDILKYS